METIAHIIEAGGVVMYPLLFLACIATIIIIERSYFFYALRPRNKGAPTDCPEQVCVNAVLDSPLTDSAQLEGLVEEIFGEYRIRLERYLGFLDTITTIAPLLGLLGTIVGMIGSFHAMSSAHAHGARDEVLRGVAEALYATAAGILIAVVCFVAYNFFTHRIRSITARVEVGVTKAINSKRG